MQVMLALHDGTYINAWTNIDTRLLLLASISVTNPLRHRKISLRGQFKPRKGRKRPSGSALGLGKVERGSMGLVLGLGKGEKGSLGLVYKFLYKNFFSSRHI